MDVSALASRVGRNNCQSPLKRGGMSARMKSWLFLSGAERGESSWHSRLEDDFFGGGAKQFFRNGIFFFLLASKITRLCYFMNAARRRCKREKKWIRTVDLCLSAQDPKTKTKFFRWPAQSIPSLSQYSRKKANVERVTGWMEVHVHFVRFRLGFFSSDESNRFLRHHLFLSPPAFALRSSLRLRFFFTHCLPLQNCVYRICTCVSLFTCPTGLLTELSRPNEERRQDRKELRSREREKIKDGSEEE